MRTASSASLLILALFSTTLAAQQTLTIPPGRTFSCAARSQNTACSYSSRGADTLHVRLQRDTAVRPQSAPALKLIATAGNTIILTDSYPSAPAGLGRCQSGSETFVRVLSAHPGHLIQTFSSRLESCTDNIEPALDGITWDASAATLHLHWLTAPATGHEKNLALHLDTNGVPDK